MTLAASFAQWVEGVRTEERLETAAADDSEQVGLLVLGFVRGRLRSAASTVADLENVGREATDGERDVLHGSGDDRGHLTHGRCAGLHDLLQGILADLCLAESVNHALSLPRRGPVQD